MHKHLTWTDRLKIEKALKEGLKPCKIADRLHVHNSTIYRELKRGTYTHLNSDLTTEERYSPLTFTPYSIAASCTFKP